MVHSSDSHDNEQCQIEWKEDEYWIQQHVVFEPLISNNLDETQNSKEENDAGDDQILQGKLNFITKYF